MALTIQSEWQQIAFLAIGAAVILFLLFRLPKLGGVIRAIFSLGMLALFFFVLLQQAPYDPTLSKIAGRIGLDNQQVVGDEVRIAMSRDGHFWAQASINGVPRRMLIDSGATVTALSAQTARAAGVEASAGVLPVVIRTANGMVTAQTGAIERLTLGGIEARNLKVVTSPSLGGFDVLGMNFLSELASWRVEGRTLILNAGGAEREPAES